MRVVVQHGCRGHTIGPMEEFIEPEVIIPGRANDDGGGARPRHRRIVPCRGAYPRATTLERPRKERVVIAQLGARGVRREDDERLLNVIGCHGRMVTPEWK